MNSRLRLQSKTLILGKNLFLTLVIIIAIAMAFAISALPYIIENTLITFLQNQNEIFARFMQLTLSFAILIFAILTLSAWNLGLDRYFFNLSQNQKASIKDIFHYFSFGKIFMAAWFSIRLFALKFLIFIFCQIPAISLILTLIFKLSTQISIAVSLILSIGIIVFLIYGFIFYKLIISSFFLVKYYYITQQYTGFLNALSWSQQAMANTKFSPFSMQLSFIAWFLSCFFIFPIIYVWSYYRQTRAVLANEIMQ